MRNLSAGKQPLSDQELDRIEAFLAGVRNERAMSVEELDGFFCALIAGPQLVMPSEYLNEVWGGELPDENAFESEAEATSLLGLMMRHWNAIVAEYETEIVYGPLFDAPDERGVPGRRWALGFMRGVREQGTVRRVEPKVGRNEPCARAGRAGSTSSAAGGRAGRCTDRIMHLAGAVVNQALEWPRLRLTR